MQTNLPADLPAGYGMPVLDEEACRLPEGFVYLDEAVSGVYWDAKYASADNFTGAPVDDTPPPNRLLESAGGPRDVARGSCGKGNQRLLVWDAGGPRAR
jgi:D-alanyl-D-alanine dipeptidase